MFSTRLAPTFRTLLVGGSLAGSLLLLPCAASAVSAPPDLTGEAAGGVDQIPGRMKPDDSARYRPFPPAPRQQTQAQADRQSAGCMSCHTQTDSKTMHASEGVTLGCVDCHGGYADVFKPESAQEGDPAYRDALDKAHVRPLYPQAWTYPSSRNPQRTYALLNDESPEFIRFINPGDYRIAREACGACHLDIIHAAERSLMSSAMMFWGGAAYNNGILPFKRYLIGEAYTRDGEAATLKNPVAPTAEMADKGVLPVMYPMPAWEVLPPGDVFRVFERGGRNITNLFPETGLPNALGLLQRIEEPGRPDIRQSNRGPGTGSRIAVPVINIHKTRLNDPNSWFIGTNDNPGDYRQSGCSGCHAVYANDRDPRHSGPYAQYGHWGQTQTVDPVIRNKTEPFTTADGATIEIPERGHPIKHQFTRAIPTSQCMICHMHQPNVFVNSYLGYTMWDYESDADAMWPDKQHYWDADDVRNDRPVDADQIIGEDEVHRRLSRNPEEAVTRGKWWDEEFLSNVSKQNPTLRDTQFADYHGHGWNFRAIFKRDRQGNLLDDAGQPVADDDPEKFNKAVHMSSIHLDVGMHCVDCHFAQDGHGNGHIQGEVAQAVEIDCMDCHGAADAYPTLKTSGPAAPPGGRDLSLLRLQDGRSRFEWRDGDLYQRSALWPDLEWRVSLVKNSANPDHPDFNAKSAHAKTVSSDLSGDWGPGVAPENWAHQNDEMTCFTCHSAWATSCAGCHLPIQANWKTRKHHYEHNETRNYASYNPQVARDQTYQLGKHGPAKGGRISPIRSSSALVLSSTNANRERIYIQQPPVAASGYSSQAFAPHFPHTVRKTETKQCEDCHLSDSNDNNAIMAQLLLHGTKFIDFLGFNAWIGTGEGVNAVRVTEWEEPQAVVGSYLHRESYPDWYEDHQNNNLELIEAYSHSGAQIGCIQHRGEYVYVTEQGVGFQVYDAANIANKGWSQRFITQPFSAAGHDTVVEMDNATCMTLQTTQPIHPGRYKTGFFGMDAEAYTQLMQETNLEQPFHELYHYALVTDAEEGLILVDINTLQDGEPRNNFLRRALTWNPDGILDGARFIYSAGYYVYVVTPDAVVVLNLDSPLKPKVVSTLPFNDPRAVMQQFRYLYVTDADGLKVVDVTNMDQPKILNDVLIPFDDAQRVFLSRTYAYVAAKHQGLGIVDITVADQPKLYALYNADNQLNDARDVVVAATNASLYAYVADGVNGLKVLQLTGPDIQPKFYGFSPQPRPKLIARKSTTGPALALARGLERDRAVDETGGQIAIFGRIGSRPFNLEEQRKLYLRNGEPWYVNNEPDMNKLKPGSQPLRDWEIPLTKQ